MSRILTKIFWDCTKLKNIASLELKKEESILSNKKIDMSNCGGFAQVWQKLFFTQILQEKFVRSLRS